MAFAHSRRRRVRAVLAAVVGIVAVLLPLAQAPGAPPPRPIVSHALSMYGGDTKYGPGFKHFAYVNPRAPRGGNVKLATLGTFDNLNPFILKGVPVAGIGETFDTLTARSSDEAFTAYGLIAESIELAGDRSWVTFRLRPEARFHDGSPITVDDVIWTFEALKTKGHPFYRSYYSKVKSVEAVGPRQVRFTFAAGENRELPLIVGEMAVLSKKYWSTRDFAKTTLEAPLGSGPYRVASLEPGRSITYERVKDYWGADLPVNVGRHNFDTIRYDYYRDAAVSIEAFKAGAYDFRAENVAKHWARAYNVPAVADGRIKKELIDNEIPTGMQAWVFNTRRPMFADRRVRRALAYAFDFEWTNAHLMYNAYTRTESYFSNSELASSGLPTPDELEVLRPFKGQVPDEVFTKEYHAPSTAPPASLRENLLTALAMLAEAGWVVKDGVLVEAKTGRPMTPEILLVGGEAFERLALPFVQNLRRLGINARIRPIDAAQFQYRVDHLDFDMIVGNWPQSLSPGNEQVDNWSSAAADVPGTRNLAGVRDPVVDKLVDSLIAAPTRRDLIARTRALDRVLLWGHYVIPHWHIQAFRVAYWDKFSRPAISPKYALGFADTWWVDPAKAARLQQIGR
jgi:microcin C transport system substrate-binding protein